MLEASLKNTGAKKDSAIQLKVLKIKDFIKMKKKHQHMLYALDAQGSQMFYIWDITFIKL